MYCPESSRKYWAGCLKRQCMPEMLGRGRPQKTTSDRWQPEGIFPLEPETALWNPKGSHAVRLPKTMPVWPSSTPSNPKYTVTGKPTKLMIMILVDSSFILLQFRLILLLNKCPNFPLLVCLCHNIPWSSSSLQSHTTEHCQRDVSSKFQKRDSNEDVKRNLSHLVSTF